MGKHKKDKSSGKHNKKKSKKHSKRYSGSDSSGSVEEIKKKSKSRKYSTESSDSSESDEWVEREVVKEKPQEVSKERDEWLALGTDLKLTSNKGKQELREEKKKADKERDTYDPSTNVRELNPYWKSGDGGLPSFQKPRDDYEGRRERDFRQKYPVRESNWRKKSTTDNRETPSTSRVPQIAKDTVIIKNTSEVVTQKDLNVIAAKLVKAEIMGNTKLAAELKIKLDWAREQVGNKVKEREEVVLTRTDSKGYTQPLKSKLDREEPSSSRKNKKQRTETHADGQRVRYFADDDKYSLKQMFESEKFNSVEEQNRQFLKLAGKVRKNDDLDDVFTDNIREEKSTTKTQQAETSRAIHEHEKLSARLDACSYCLQSDDMLKHLMVSAGENVYVSLPSYEPLTDGHCFIVPVKHTTCATQLDENEWSELMDYRRALVKMYETEGDDVVFVETAMGLHRHPHMRIECIPMPKSVGELAPIYFKKAIDESEKEWASNKKLISLRGRDVRRAVPKGLPYFSVSFGVDDEGFAHVIEDEKDFPRNFAQEIVGGMLDLHHSKWRKPKRQKFDEQSERVRKFSKQWREFDPKRE